MWPLPTLHPWSIESLQDVLAMAGRGTLADVASAAWPSANTAILVPFTLDLNITVTQLWTFNGSTVASSPSLDVGIYSTDGTLLVSAGSTTQSGTSALQLYNVTDTAMGPGLFYLALVTDQTTNSTFISRAVSPALFLATAGCAQVNSAGPPLPATATFASMAQTYLPLFGLLWSRTVL